jgi:2-haloacid dehalogenase
VTPAAKPVAAVWFDLFGTLVDLGPLVDACEVGAPGRGAELAARWRARQVEASWLRTLMDRWVPFETVTREALEDATADVGVDVDVAGLDALDGAFERLPARAGAADCLRALRDLGVPTGILSNGSAAMIERASQSAGLRDLVDEVRSVDAVRRYKPDPAVYRLAVDASGVEPARIGFVTANGWDAAGAAAFGFRVAWLRPDRHAVVPSVGAPLPLVSTWEEVPLLFDLGR